MADEVATFTFQFSGEDQFIAAMAKMGAAADAMVQKVNAAFGTIKPPAAGGDQAVASVKKLGEEAEKTGSKFAAMAEKLGSVGASISGSFGEAGKLLGDLGEKAAKSVGGIGTAFEGAAKAGGGLTDVFKAIGPAAATGIGAVVVAAGALAAFAAESAEKYNELVVATRTSFDEFRRLDAVGASFGLSAAQTAGAVQAISNGLREGAIGAREMSEQLQYMQDRIADIAVRRQEGEISAREQAQESARSIESAERGLVKAREEYARHGAKLTPGEQEAKGEEDRLQRVKDAEQAVADAHQKAADEQRKEAERRQSEATQAERAQAREHRAALTAMEQAPPIQRTFTDYAQQVKGIKELPLALDDAAQAMEKLNKVPVGEKFAAVLQIFDEMKSKGIDVSRALTETFSPEVAAKVTDNLHELAEAARQGKAALDALAASKGINTEEMNKQLVKLSESIQKLERDFLQMATKAGAAIAKIASAFDPLIKAMSFVADVANKFEEILDKITRATGARPLSELPGKKTPEAAAGQQPSGFKPYAEAGHTGPLPITYKESEHTGPLPASAADAAPKVEKLGTAADAAAAKLSKIGGGGDGGQPETKAGGGLITGPGTGTSDSIPIRASRGEYIIRADGGNLGAAIAHFADGGLVEEEQELGWETYFTNLQRKIAGLKKELQELQEQEKGGDNKGIGVSVPSKVETNKYGVRTRVYFNADGTPRSFETLSGGGGEGGGGDKKSAEVKELEAQITELEDQLERAQNSKKDQELTEKRKELDEKELAMRGFHAAGGMIHGPGGPTSDAVPIMASHGEYVVRAAAVSHLGRSFMDRINAAPGFDVGGLVDAFSLNMPRFQAGGMVHGPVSAAALHPVTINLPDGKSISGFHGTASAVAQLSQHAVLQQGSSTGRRPSWDR